MPVLEFWRNQVPVYDAVCILTALGHGVAWHGKACAYTFAIVSFVDYWQLCT